MARVNVFLKDDLLVAADAAADESGMNRSALFQAALIRYLEDLRKAREEADSLRSMDEACRRMDGLAEKLGSWDPVRVIRESRDTRSRGPGHKPKPTHTGRRS